MPFGFGKPKTIASDDDARSSFFVGMMPALSGKSQIQPAIAKYVPDPAAKDPANTKPILCLDADALAQSLIAADPTLSALDTAANAAVLEAMMCKKLHDTLFGLIQTRPDVTVLCLTSNITFVNYLQMKPKRTFVYIPCSDLCNKMYQDFLASGNKDSASTLLTSKEQIMAWATQQGINPVVYAVLDDIIADLAAKLSLVLGAY